MFRSHRSYGLLFSKTDEMGITWTLAIHLEDLLSQFKIFGFLNIDL